MITKNEGENGNVTITGKDSIWNNTGVLSLGILNDTDYDKKLTSNASITINNGGRFSQINSPWQITMMFLYLLKVSMY
jgi:hypothetical protein